MPVAKQTQAINSRLEIQSRRHTTNGGRAHTQAEARCNGVHTGTKEFFFGQGSTLAPEQQIWQHIAHTHIAWGHECLTPSSNTSKHYLGVQQISIK